MNALLLLGLLFLLSQQQHKDFGPPLSTFTAGDITVTRFAGGFAKVSSPRSECIAAGAPPHVVEILRGSLAACTADVRTIG
jgi:hypothetical protein